MTGQSSPHDAVFRRILGEPGNAASQLQAVLPTGVADRLDLAELTRVPGSFVDAELRWRHSDLLFTAPLQDRQAFLYVLVEHQSGTDPLMPLRILRYLVRIWDRYLTDHPHATRLPAIIPLVVHHHRRPWTGPTDMNQLIDLDPETAEALAQYLPRLTFLLDDLARVDETTLMTRPLTPPARMTVGETPTNELHDLFAHLSAEAEEAYMTTAEMLRAEGEARGEARGRAEALVQLLTHRFGPLPPAASERVNTATIDQLTTWTTHALTADTLDQALR